MSKKPGKLNISLNIDVSKLNPQAIAGFQQKLRDAELKRIEAANTQEDVILCFALMSMMMMMMMMMMMILMMMMMMMMMMNNEAGNDDPGRRHGGEASKPDLAGGTESA